MEIKIHHASVERVTAMYGGQVEVLAHFHDGGTQVKNAKSYPFTFVASESYQPRVGSSVYIAIGELPPNKSPIKAITDDLEAHARTRARGKT